MGKGGFAKQRLAVLGIIGLIAIISAIGLGLGVGLLPVEEGRGPTVTVFVTEDSSTPRSTTIDGEVEIPIDGSKESKQGKYRYAGVASDAAVCSTIGTDILARDGGSAVDAAIATLLCVGVCNAQSTGIGGGHFMTVYIRKTKETTTFISREVAPMNATELMFKNQSSVLGGLAIGVPGEVSGMYAAHQKFGKLEWKRLFEPTIKLCKDGVPVYRSLYEAMRSTSARNYFDPNSEFGRLITNPNTNETYKEGEKMKRPKLARTLEIIAEQGPDAFYNGSLSNDIVQDIEDAGGIITLDDLKNYTVTEEEPITFRMKDGITLYSPRPPSSGLVLSYILNILDGYNLTTSDIGTTEKQVLTYHRVIEAFKFAYAKRTTLGDERFLPNIAELIKNLTNADFGEAIRAKITDDQTHGYRYYEPDFAEKDAPVGTTHLSVVSPNGDAVAITSTINLYFGSKVVGSRTGIIFNNEMDDFSTPGTVNAFNVPASPANYIRPGKRPLSSMSPSIFVDEKGDVRLVVGASGGTQITTTIAWVAMRSLWFGEDMKTAIDAPRLHHQLVPEETRYDKGLPQVIVDGLIKKGHKMADKTVTSVCQGVLEQGGAIYACSDRRKGGVPDGY